MLLIASTGPEEKCEVPADPAYPLCAQKVEVSSPKAGYRGHVYCILTVCLAVSAGPLAVRPLLCLLWGGWYPLLYIDVPQQNRGLLSASSWKKPLGSAVASKAALLYREGSNTADWGRLWSRSNDSFYALFDTITIQQTEIRTNLSPLYEDLSNSSSPTVDFMHSRVKRMSDQWIKAGQRMKQRVNNMDSKRMRV